MRCVSMFVSSSTASPSSGGAITIGASGGLGLYLRHAWRGLRRLHAGRGLAKGSGQTAGREWLLRAPRRLAGVDVVVVRPARVVVDVLEPPVGQHALLRVHHREARLTTPRTRLPRRRTHGSLPSRASPPTCCTMIEPTSSISFLTASSYAARAADPERVLTDASRLGAGGAGWISRDASPASNLSSGAAISSPTHSLVSRMSAYPTPGASHTSIDRHCSGRGGDAHRARDVDSARVGAGFATRPTPPEHRV